MYSTQVSQHVNASRAAVYRALLDADAIAIWRVPAGMSSHVHEFDAREGGSFRISLTYDAPDGTGKSAPHADTYHGQFLKLVPNEQVVEVFEFETTDPALSRHDDDDHHAHRRRRRHRCPRRARGHSRPRPRRRQRDRYAHGTGKPCPARRGGRAFLARVIR